jgi:Ca2+-transporting ATPase
VRKAVVFAVSVHIPIAGLSMIPAFVADWPLLLLPAHIAFLELVIDPSCSLVFEAEAPDANVMRRPPRSPHERLFSRRTLVFAVLQGASVLALCLGIVSQALPVRGPDATRALCFAVLVVCFLMIILVDRSWDRPVWEMIWVPNRALWWVSGGALAALAAVLLGPRLRSLFVFDLPKFSDVVLVLIAGAACLLWLDALKLLWAHWQKGGAALRPRRPAGGAHWRL